MLRYRIIYLCLMAAIVALFIFYPAYISSFLLVSLLLVTALSALCAFAASRRLTTRLDADAASADRDGGLMFTLIMKNGWLLPLPMVRAKLRFENTLNGSIHEQLTFASVGPLGLRGARYRFASAFCGRITVELTQLRVYDYFGLFCFPQKACRGTYAFVVPGPGDGLPGDKLAALGERLPIDITPRAQESDSMDIIGIRDYREADRLRSIHWKVSVKLDELMVKQFSEQQEPSVVIICELAANGAALLDLVVGTAVALSELFSENGIQHRFEWHDSALGANIVQPVTSEQDSIDMMYGLLSSRWYAERPLALLCHESRPMSHADAYAFYVTGLVTAELEEFAARYGALRTTVLFCGPPNGVPPRIRKVMSEMDVNIIDVRE